MPELNREDIIKALECCNTGTMEDCAKCPRVDVCITLDCEECMEVLMRDALTLIKQLTEEKRDIFEEIDRLMLDGAIGGKYPAKVINPEKYADLKKKYVGE